MVAERILPKLSFSLKTWLKDHLLEARRLKSEFWQSWFFLEAGREKSVPCLPPGFWQFLATFGVPWLVATSLQFSPASVPTPAFLPILFIFFISDSTAFGLLHLAGVVRPLSHVRLFVLKIKLRALLANAWSPHVIIPDRKSTRLNSSHSGQSRMPSSA